MTALFGTDFGVMFEDNEVRWTNRGKPPVGADLWWDSPDHPDTTGAYYPYEATVPFATLTDLVAIRKNENVTL